MIQPPPRAQPAAHALMPVDSAAREASRAVLLFLGPAEADELDVEKLLAAIAQVRGALTSEARGAAAPTADTLPGVDSQGSHW